MASGALREASVKHALYAGRPSGTARYMLLFMSMLVEVEGEVAGGEVFNEAGCYKFVVPNNQ